MTTPTLEQFRARYPEFAGVDDTLTEAVIAEADAETGSLWPQDKRGMVIMLTAAHILSSEGGKKRTGGAVAGPVVSRKVGDVATSYGAVSGAGGASSADEATTPYGRRLMKLRQAVFAGQFRAV